MASSNLPVCAQCGKPTRGWWQPLIGTANFCRVAPFVCVQQWVAAHRGDARALPVNTPVTITNNPLAQR